MAVQIKRKAKTFETAKKAITIDGFKAALQARRLAELRTQAKGHFAQQQETAARHSQADRSHEGHTATEPVAADREANGNSAVSMDVDQQEADQQRQAEADQARQARIKARQAERLLQKAQTAAKRKHELAQAEQQRKDRLAAIEEEKRKCVAKCQQWEEGLTTGQSELESMKEQKAKLVAQLKQVLQVEEALRVRALTVPAHEEGKALPALPPLKLPSATSG